MGPVPKAQPEGVREAPFLFLSHGSDWSNQCDAGGAALATVVGFSVFLSIVSGFILILCTPGLSACELDRLDASDNVEWVHDGDTVSLESGPRVRMIGLNAPELGRDGKQGQPYGDEARRALHKLLAGADHRVRLRYGKEREDHHGRTLAHMYLADGRNLSAEMLKRGLAVAITVPPNDWNLECYRQAEAEARENGLGIWTLSAFQKLDSRHLGEGERGYRIVAGVVKRTAKSRHATWLNLLGGLGVYIAHSDAPYFNGMDFSSLEGRQIIARGWLHARNSRLRMRLRHAADLSIVDFQ